MIQLTNKKGQIIPFIGLGTFPFQGEIMADMVASAVAEGYRLFDTADDYRGEPGIGMALEALAQKGICAREDLFLQTKISDNNAHADEPLIGVYFNPNHPFMKRHSASEVVREKVATSLRAMQTSYIDSLLIHYPYPDYYIEIWKEMIRLKEDGLVRYIGVSNFHARHIKRLFEETGIFPDINEIYISPISTKESLVSYCLEHNCIPMTYSPLKDEARGRINMQTINPIANKYGKSPAQVILRWNIDRGCLPLPKTKTPSRLKENFNIWDFSLSEEEVRQISLLNKDYQFLVESKICPGL